MGRLTFMMAMWSRTFANSETSCMGSPSSPTKGATPTAAVRVRLAGVFSLARSSWRKERKLAESWSRMALQPTPCLLGYSQLWHG